DRSGGCGPRRSEACGRCRITQLSAEWLRTCPEQEHDNQTGLPGRNGQGEARRAPTTTDHERRIELLHIPVGAGLRHSLFVGHERIEAHSDAFLCVFFQVFPEYNDPATRDAGANQREATHSLPIKAGAHLATSPLSPAARANARAGTETAAT